MLTSQDITTARRLITAAVQKHMPSAAVASGWASAVDPRGWVRRISDLFPFVDRPESMGLTALTLWLKTRGIEAGEHYVKALRQEWLMTRMAVESRRGPVVCFTDARSLT